MDLWQAVTIDSEQGKVEARYYESPGAGRGAIWVGGIGGGYDTPARGLYPRLCEELLPHGISSLRIRFRFPTDLDASVSDTLAGLDFLSSEGVGKAALTGHSFGGPVAIRAAARSGMVRTVVTLSTQSYGAEPVAGLAPRPLLLIHGASDTVLPYYSSEHVYLMAGEPKRLVIIKGAGHMLDEAAEEVHRYVADWVAEHLR